MKFFASAMATGLLFFAVQDVQAFDPDGGNALWGEYAIRTCRSCHKGKGLTSLDPRERSLEKWQELFNDDYKRLRDLDHDFPAVGISDRQLENIHRYLVDTASMNMGETIGSSTSVTKASPKTSKASTSSVKKSSSTKGSSSKKSGMVAGSASKTFDMNAGNAGKGRYIFRKCLACHKKNGAPIISPADRTKKAWDRYFSSGFRKFKKAMPEFDTYKYSVAQMEHLHQFFRKYALDAAKPKTCE
jgi:cytochrome c2